MKFSNLELRMDFEEEDLLKALGLGVAGNFTGHLEQAGESKDFTNVEVSEAEAPKGVFPFYVPTPNDERLGQFPLSSEKIILPEGQFNLQIEPEVALICQLEYQDQKLIDIKPRFFAAYNDCSIRKPGAAKISEKKNWGPHSKGLSKQVIPIDRFEEGGIMDNYNIASYMLREGQLHTYGINSPLLGYSYFYRKLISWLVNKVNHQQDSGPLEDISALVQKSDYPRQAVISIGATRYTEFGESTYLKKSDEIYVAVYDSKMYKVEQLEETLLSADFHKKAGLSVLHQEVV